MGKHEVGTPKYIANKIKAKGLQKLRWFCQMCEKQCRDENGFKCHISSESHQRQLLIFADNADQFIDEFSKQFETGYLELLKRQFGTKRVPANKVYQEYISDRNHLHMNSTQWETLTDFVKWLGRQGKCVVDETEKGWFVTYIDRDPEVIQRQEALAKKEKMEKDDNERMMIFLEKQIECGKAQFKTSTCEPTEIKKDEDKKLLLKLNTVKKTDSKPYSPILVPLAFTGSQVKRKKDLPKKPAKKTLTALEAIIKEEQESLKKQTMNKRIDYWLVEDIVVKVITRSLGNEYYKMKGVVVKVIDKYAAIVKLLESNCKLKLDEAHLETVIPNIGKKVKILNGLHRGVVAELLSIDIDKYCANVKLLSGPLKNNVVKEVPYEDICKINET